ncbi:phosphodiester glycosidase family protein [Devosia nitrariae]|uniref:Phosphodiester glycosidase domain-containing protein n=1 Tax=Devosia nitrariae TaxID=2071872 RepID=A0ABQ5W9E8_9HYPH|nr:phosphodiester glycosidase family protein [Devosia nitrariae]GLQ56508.1 hypothetical protein GCM10010862_37670 [Devosia nitrariae]
MSVSKTNIVLSSGAKARIVVAEAAAFAVEAYSLEPAVPAVRRIAARLARARLGAPVYDVPHPSVRQPARSYAWGDGRSAEVHSARVGAILDRLAEVGTSPVDLWCDRRGTAPTRLPVPMAGTDLLRLRSASLERHQLLANGSYFLFHHEEFDTPFEAYGDPIGLVAVGGTILAPAQVNRASLTGRAGRFAVERVQFCDLRIVLPGGQVIATHAFGDHDPGLVAGPIAMARYFGALDGRTPVAPAVTEVVIVGRHAVAVIAGGNVPIPRTGCVLRFPGRPDAKMLDALIAGEPLDYVIEGQALKDAVQAGPRIVSGGQVSVDEATMLAEHVFVREASGDLRQPSPFRWHADAHETRAARLGAGVRADRTLFFCAIEGRSSYSGGGQARGATLHDLAYLLVECGAVDGLHLDGGGSMQLFRPYGGALLTPGDVCHDFADPFAEYDRPVPLGLRLDLS